VVCGSWRKQPNAHAATPPPVVEPTVIFTAPSKSFNPRLPTYSFLPQLSFFLSSTHTQSELDISSLCIFVRPQKCSVNSEHLLKCPSVAKEITTFLSDSQQQYNPATAAPPLCRNLSKLTVSSTIKKLLNLFLAPPIVFEFDTSIHHVDHRLASS
jgi:hypothetical protein